MDDLSSEHVLCGSQVSSSDLNFFDRDKFIVYLWNNFQGYSSQALKIMSKTYL